MAFLEVITRCYKRRVMLYKNMESMGAQLCPDWTQRLLVDEVGIGVTGANARLSSYTPCGSYVWILDDDDLCVDVGLVSTLQRLAEEHRQPPAIMLRMDHGPLGILPDAEHWAKEPERGRIGCSAIVTRRDVWMAHRRAWVADYSADFDFIHSVWAEHAPNIVWCDRVASRVQQISQGAAVDG